MSMLLRTSLSTSPAPASQYIASDTAGTFAVTIQAPQGIGNPTATAGYITFKRTGNTSPERDYFLPGQFKPWVVATVYGSDGGTSGLTGSTIKCYIVGGLTGP